MNLVFDSCRESAQGVDFVFGIRSPDKSVALEQGRQIEISVCRLVKADKIYNQRRGLVKSG